MFDREVALERWRERMLEHEAIQESDVLELENHLVEHSEELQANGLTEEESFFVASRRLGDPLQLSAEYQKACPGAVVRQRLFWMLVGGVCYVLLILSLGMLIELGGVTYLFVVPASSASKWGYAGAACVAPTLLVGILFLGFGNGRLGRWQNLFRRLAAKPFPLFLLLLAVGAAAKLSTVETAVLRVRLARDSHFYAEVTVFNHLASIGVAIVLFVVMTVLLYRLRRRRVPAASE